MPKSRNRKFKGAARKAMLKRRQFARSLHQAFVALVTGSIDRDTFRIARNLALKDLLRRA